MESKELVKLEGTTEEAVFNALQKIFTMDGEKSTQEMSVLVQRIPILCTSVVSMQKSIEKIEANINWVIKLILGAVILAIVYTVIKH